MERVNGRAETQHLTSFKRKVCYNAGNQPRTPLLILLLMLACQQEKSYDYSTQASAPAALVLCPWPYAGMGTYSLTSTGRHKFPLTNLPLAR